MPNDEQSKPEILHEPENVSSYDNLDERTKKLIEKAVYISEQYEKSSAFILILVNVLATIAYIVYNLLMAWLNQPNLMANPLMLICSMFVLGWIYSR